MNTQASAIAFVGGLLLFRMRSVKYPTSSSAKLQALSLQHARPEAKVQKERADAQGDTTNGYARQAMVDLEDIAVPAKFHTKPHAKVVFVIDGKADEWPKKWEEPAENEMSDAAKVAVALKAAMKDADGKNFRADLLADGISGKNAIRVNAAEADGGAGDVAGDMLIFPDEVRVRGLGAAGAAAFVEKVLVPLQQQRQGGGAGGEGPARVSALVAAAGLNSGRDGKGVQVMKLPERGHHVFVCAHTKRDMRCGVIGPHLIRTLRLRINQALTGSDTTVVTGTGAGTVSVRGCSHVGGHTFAGNVLWFGRRSTSTSGSGGSGSSGSILGDWYGYVDDQVASLLVDRYLGSSGGSSGSGGDATGIRPLYRYWRGGMGLRKEQMTEACTADCGSC